MTRILLGFQETDTGEFNTTEILLVNEEHQLAADLQEGITTITTSEKAVSIGLPQGEVTVIAINPADEVLSDTSEAVLFCYDEGDSMFTGTAPARRVGTFLLNDVADSLTEEGWALFDASVFWSMGYSTSIKELALELPRRIALYNNYPNPFNPKTNISFYIPEQLHVKLSVWNPLGKEVARLVDKNVSPGRYSVTFNASDLSSGIYFYRLDVGSYHVTKKMIALK